MKRKTMSITKRILLLGYVTILILVIALVSVSMTFFINHDINAIYDQTDMLCEAYSSSVGNVVSRVYLEIDRASKDPEIAENFKNMTPEELQTYLIDDKTGKKKEYMFYTLSILDKDGVTYDGFDLSAREYVKKSSGGKA